MQNQTLDLVAKLLANENINVVRAPVATAAFDIVGRTLILPQWKEMTPSIDQMLVAHEVSHALFTSTDYHDALDTRLRFKRAKAFLNILEDVRIEKLMKRRYPGLRKVFTAGYKELNEMDFFQIRGRDLQSAHLMDRINLYFKVGYGIVDFTPDEKVFVTRADNLETIEETIQLTEDIHNFLKQQEEKNRELVQQAQAEAQAEEEVEDIPDADDEDTEHSFNDLVDNDYDDSEDEEEGPEQDANTTGSDDAEGQSEEQEDEGESESAGEEGEESDETSEGNIDSTEGATSEANGEMEDGSDEDGEMDNEGELPTTNSAFESRVSELADTSTEYDYWKLDTVKYDPIVPFKEVTRIIDSSFEGPVGPSRLADIQNFKRDTQNNVDYMVKEFEMRKAATAYKRAQTAKVGSLNMNKVWAYKLNDDLFKRVTTVKQGKNHGMVFLLDWSGSMQNVIGDTIDQVINLAMFCQRAGIAYQVFAFTDRYITDSAAAYQRGPGYVSKLDANNQRLIDVSVNNFALLELFSNKMNQSDFNAMVNNLKSKRAERVFPLNGTPLNESLVFMYDYIGKFQKMNNVEKISFITLTDGQGAGLPCWFDNIRYNSENKRINVRSFIQDTFTKKNHEISRETAGQTTVLIELIKARYNCTVLGFYITKNSRRDLCDAMRAHYSKMDQMEIWSTVERMKSEFRTNGYASLMNTGRDELFIVPTTNTKVQYEQLEVDSSASARSIASKFGKFMSTKKTSRILLNKFIGYVA